MRKNIDIDHLLENAVATALGLPRPHKVLARKIRATKPRHAARLTHREPHRIAA